MAEWECERECGRDCGRESEREWWCRADRDTRASGWGPRDGGAAHRWRPLAGAALLDRLRFTGCRRPSVDPERVRRLRSTLEPGLAAGAPGAASGLHGPVVVTKDGLAEVLDGAPGWASPPGAEREPTLALACGALVDTLFRQLVTTGSIGEPMADGLAGLRVDDRRAGLVGWIDRLAPGERAELEAEVTRQAVGMQARWPTLDPRWLPRTHQCMRVPLLGGRVELAARVDLAIGRPAVTESSVALVQVRSGLRRPAHRADLHFDALVETLRTGAPPFVVATYSTATGELDAEQVTDAMLDEAARRTAAGGERLCRRAAAAAPAEVVGPVAPGDRTVGAPGPAASPGALASPGRLAAPPEDDTDRPHRLGMDRGADQPVAA